MTEISAAQLASLGMYRPTPLGLASLGMARFVEETFPLVRGGYVSVLPRRRRPIEEDEALLLMEVI